MDRRRNSDEELRQLERDVRVDLTLLPKLLQVSARLGSYAAAVRVLIDVGWEAGAIVIAPLDLGSPRDDLVIELGRELVCRGWSPDLPLTYNQYRERDTVRPGTTVGDDYGMRALFRSTRSIRLHGSFGRYATWQFHARYGFRGFVQDHATNRNQGHSFFFKIEPAGRNHVAETFGRTMVRDGRVNQLRRVAPDSWFLYRWDDSQSATMSHGLGGTGLWAGLPAQYPLNQIYFYTQASRHRRSRLAPGDSPEHEYELFVRTSRAFLPGDVIPERPDPGDPQAATAMPYRPWQSERPFDPEADRARFTGREELASSVRAWLMDPSRLERIKALFYGDLWLGGLLIPPEEVRYDPVTMEPVR